MQKLPGRIEMYFEQLKEVSTNHYYLRTYKEYNYNSNPHNKGDTQIT